MVATALALALRLVAELAGIEKALFGYGVGVDVTDYPVKATRGVVYPLFVALARPLGLQGIFAIQTFLYFAAGIALFARLARLSPPGRPMAWLTALAGLAALINPRVLEYPLSISEEALFIPALMALLLALLAHLERPRLATAAAAGILCGLAIGIRGIGVAFVPMLAAAPVVAAFVAERDRGRWRAALLGAFAAIAAAAATVGVERAAHSYMVGGAKLRSVFGINVIGKLPFIVEPGDLAASPANPAEAEALRKVEAVLLRSGALARASEAELKTWDGRQFFTNYLEYVFLMHGLNPDLMRAVGDLAGLRGRPDDAVALEVSLAAIGKRPLRFGARVLGNFMRFFMLAEFPGTAGREDAVAAAHRLAPAWPDPVMWDAFHRMADVAKSYRLPAWALRLAFAAAAAGIVMAVGAAGWAAMRRRRVPIEAGFGVVAALGFLAYFLFCAIAINVEVRYVMTVWPLTVLLALLALSIPARNLPARAPAPKP